MILLYIKPILINALNGENRKVYFVINLWLYCTHAKFMLHIKHGLQRLHSKSNCVPIAFELWWKWQDRICYSTLFWAFRPSSFHPSSYSCSSRTVFVYQGPLCSLLRSWFLSSGSVFLDALFPSSISTLHLLSRGAWLIIDYDSLMDSLSSLSNSLISLMCPPALSIPQYFITFYAYVSCSIST